MLTNLDQFNKLLVSKSISHVEIRSLRAKKKTKVFSETGYWFAGREVCGEKRSNPPYCKSGSFLSRPPCLHKILFPNVKPHTCTVLSIDLGGVGKLSSFIITPFDDSYTPTTLDMLPYRSMIDVTFPWNKCNKVKKKKSKKEMVNYFGRGYCQTTGACPSFETDLSSWRVDFKLLTDLTFW